MFIGRLPFFAKADEIQRALINLSKYDSKSHRNYRDKYNYKDFRRSRIRSRSPFSDIVCPRVNIVHDLVTGYSCRYAFAYFSSPGDAKLVLDNWLHQTDTLLRQKQTERCGLDIPNGDRVCLNTLL